MYVKKAKPYDRNVWRYDLLSLSSLTINPNTSPLVSYLYGEIKRGTDGNYYIPNMGEASDQIHAYNGSGYDNYTYTADTLYKLASGLSTQVYKVFDNSKTIKEFVRAVGNKDYELRDHLGNVRVVISDAKLITDQDASNTVSSSDLFTPEVLSYSDQYAFGFDMPGRQFSSGEKYRYNYNGKETDPESGLQDYGMRMYDKRIGRFPSVDPLSKKYPHYSPYQFAGNTPIVAVDLDGAEDQWIHYSENNDGSYTEVNNMYDVDAVQRYSISQSMGGIDIPNTGVVYTVDHVDGTKEVKKVSETVVVTPQKTVFDQISETVVETLEAGDRGAAGYHGEKGFKKLGGDLSDGSTYLKAGGVIVAGAGVLTGNPTLVAGGAAIYDVGAVMDDVGTGILVISDLNDGNGTNATVRVLGATAGKVTDAAVDGSKVGNAAEKFFGKAAAGEAVDATKDASLEKPENKK